MSGRKESWHVSRREFLTTTAAWIGSAAIPSISAAPVQGAARWTRINLSDPNTPQAKKDQLLGSYKKAIRAMLALPPDNALNWYRNAFIHTADCPHGNWWFFVWHRGYLGWFEKKCRELSGDPDFALPYWDWTTTLTDKRVPCVPDYMFDDVLDPKNQAFIDAGGIGNHDDFKSKFKDAVRKLDYWDLNPDGSLNPFGKYAHLLARGIRSPDDLWFDIIENPAGQFFFDQANARGPTKLMPELVDPATQKAVSLPTILDALSPRDFITFASFKVRTFPGVGAHNTQNVGFGVLEGQPHNLVHNSVGFPKGFMGNFLSPVDPIFFLHHANLDRLWDIWTRKQTAHKNPNQYPILPDGYLNPQNCDDPDFGPKSDYDFWSCETFLFFVDEKGKPVTKTKASDYATIGDFNYDYQPGSGEEVVPPATAIVAAPALAEIQRFAAQITAPSLSTTQAASGAVTVPPALLQAAAEPGAPKLFAKITVIFPPIGHAPLDVLINVPPGATDIGPLSPFFAGALEMFGTHILQGPVTFTVSLSTPLNTLRANKQLDVNRPLDIRVVPSAMPQTAMAHAAAPRAEVVSIVVEAH